MSRIEIAIIVVLAIIPLMAIFIIKPKRKKKEVKADTKTLDQIKKEETPATPPAPKPIESPMEFKPTSEFVGLEDEDFEKFLKEKASKAKRPSRLEPNEISSFPLDEFDDMDIFSDFEKKEKSVKSEWESLSPEMKALVMSNIFDKKY